MPPRFDEFTGTFKNTQPRQNFQGTIGPPLRSSMRLQPDAMSYTRAEIRRENSISDMLSQEDSKYFPEVPLSEPMDKLHFKSEVSSCGKPPFEYGSDHFLPDQNSLNNHLNHPAFS